MAVDLSALRQKLEELKTGQKALDSEYMEKYLVLKEGETVVRILPGRGEDTFYAETALHRVNGRNLHCPGRKLCPICKYVSKLYDSKVEENIDLARNIKSRKRFYFNVIAREYANPATGEVEANAGPKIFSCGVKLFEKILNTFVDSDFGDLTDLGEGWDFKIMKKEKDGFPNYDDSSCKPRSTPASSDLEEVTGWMDNLHDLQALIRRKTAEELQEELKTFLESEGLQESAPAPTETTTPAPEIDSTPETAASVEVTEAPAETEAATGDDGDDFLAELRKLKEEKGK